MSLLYVGIRAVESILRLLLHGVGSSQLEIFVILLPLNVASATLVDLIAVLQRPHLEVYVPWSKVGLHQEAFTHYYETSNVKHSIRSKVVGLNLDAIVEEKASKTPRITNGNNSTLSYSSNGGPCPELAHLPRSMFTN